ncbi:LPS export ABC transporter permease LptG [Epibacterium sp. SM1969]|uniref:LPS export ABC transporter permease LptG n=1 Tax=Tritonibacter aquimaris TaxID=2663379 RepID=A0A844ASA4_9RHOB|nr:LPS export ABC transporter permease LptG [Tritonibacter aquimaris]MQY41254.1 LPS export ABC transporter permease LptG [Tritonibacter aquimaris]
MKLDLYYARRFFQWLMVISAVLMTLVSLIDLNEQIRRFDAQDLSFAQLMNLTLLNVAPAYNEFLPLIMILTTIVLFVGLARSSELVVTRAAGRSGIRALVPPLVVAALVGLFALTTLNPIAAATANRYKELADGYRNGGAATFSLSREGLWLRQGTPDGQSVIHAKGYMGDGEDVILQDVSILEYHGDLGPQRRINADTAILEGSHWVLQNAKAWPLTTGFVSETAARVHDTLELPTTLTSDRIRDTIGATEGISIYNLPDAIRDQGEAGFSTKRYEVLFQVELARPLFLVAMVLVGASFTMRHTRFGGTGMAVLAAVLLGFGLYFVRNFAQILGENGQVPVALAAWGPPVASIMLTLGLLLHAEDG